MSTRLLIALSLTGCAHTAAPGTVSTIEQDHVRVRGSEQPACRVVFLPGLGDDASTYARYEFVRALSDRGIEADVVVLDERLGPDADGVERLREHVLDPSSAAGYSKHWLVGVSLGAGTAIRAAATHPDLVQGVVAFAPVLSSPGVVKAARRAGGLHMWEHPDANDEMGKVFRWLRNRHRTDGTQVPIHLAWGAEDPLGSISELISTAVERPLIGGGGHEWQVWRALWGGWLDHGYLQRSCGAPRRSSN